MKPTLTVKLAGVLLLPFLLATLLLAAFYQSYTLPIAGPPFNNMAGRAHMLAEMLSDYARMVHNGQDEARATLRDLVRIHDRMLDVCEHGGTFEGSALSSPPRFVADDLALVRQHWDRARPLYLSVADLPRLDRASQRAYEEMDTLAPEMMTTWDRVRDAVASHVRSSYERKLIFLGAGALANLLVFLFGLWLVRRAVVRPLARLGGAPAASPGAPDEIGRIEEVMSEQRLNLTKTYAELRARNEALATSEEQMTARIDQIGAIAEALSRFLSSGSWKDASAILLQESLCQTRSEFGFLGVVVEGPALRIYAHQGIEWDRERGRAFYQEAARLYLEQGYLDFQKFDSLYGEVLKTGAEVIANDVARDPRATGRPEGHPPLHTFLGVPMRKGEETVGMIAVANRLGGYTDAERRDIEVLANAAAVMYESHVRREREASLAEQLRQSQKMEAIGRLAGGVAHDFNNLLTAMIGHAQLLAEGLGSEHPQARRVQEVRACGDRAAVLTRQLLAFGRKQVLEPRVLLLNEAVQRMGDLLRRLIGEDIDLVVMQAPDIGRIKADPGQMEQVIMNLVVNARDAMPDGGRLTIDTAGATHQEVRARANAEAPEGRYVRLMVQDTGCGMSEEVRSRIFEPYFTTKPQGKGTGLGLATVFGIVQQHGGHIGVGSDIGKGTSFFIYFPCTEEELPAPSAPKETARVLGGRETVLVAEDEEVVRSVVCEFLRAGGYAVIEACGGRDALGRAGGHDGRIHLLVTDVIMPDMKGTELARELCRARPDLRVLYISGYPADADLRAEGLPQHALYLQKPFTQGELHARVREALDAQLVAG